MISKFRNPILGGFYPDPSICRAGDDFYLVNSTFAYFPGIPVFHSRDLRRWKQIGNAISRPGQLCYDGHRISEGLFAPTIRYNRGLFYILCTLIRTGGNFIITAQDPAGPWSDPVWLNGADGIDPSIFFDCMRRVRSTLRQIPYQNNTPWGVDCMRGVHTPGMYPETNTLPKQPTLGLVDDDGKVWYTGTHPAPEGEAYPGNYEIYIQEMDLAELEKGKNPLIGTSHGIWRGALRNAIWPEGPHIYRINGWYYLLYAEGGTSRDHAVCVARSKNIRGPWEGKPGNPILTHRYLGKNAEIVNAGHADLVDDTLGNWWMVLLASRPFNEVCPLGRETFMVPVVWEDDWPRVASDSGLIENEFSLPNLKTGDADGIVWNDTHSCDHFNGQLPFHWLMLRMPVDAQNAALSLVARPGALRLFTKAATMRGREHPAFAGRRLQHKNWTFMAALEFNPQKACESAGIILLQSEDFQYRLELYAASSIAEAELSLRLVRASGKADEIIANREWGEAAQSPGNPLILAARCEEMELSFFYGKDQYSLECFANGLDARILSTEYAGGFTGTLAGVFATGNGTDTPNYADVIWAMLVGSL
jgi:alpha-N-arabinofuranosidase